MTESLTFVSPDTQIDLTNCDREPIHIPGAVQPHGMLFGINESDGTVVVVSESVELHLGTRADTVLHQPFAAIVGDTVYSCVKSLVADGTERRFDSLVLEHGKVEGQAFDVTVHRSGNLLLVELEPALDEEKLTVERISSAVRATIERLERADSVTQLANELAVEMRHLTGFDRVWVYKFHPDWHGEIIGEAKRDDIETWLGMHYPASDIPAQARALFLKNWLRVIPDVSFEPSPLVPGLNPINGEPIDLGNSVLRSVSPIHIQYLKNMGVKASLVISLIHRGKLWGLISGHHYAGPKRVPYSTRSVCEFLAQALSLQIGVTDRLADRDRALLLRDRLTRLFEQLTVAEGNLSAALAEGSVTLAELIDADGAALVQGGITTLVGATPTSEQIDALVEWLDRKRERAFESSALSQSYPPAAEYADVASGLLAVPLAGATGGYLLWFRKERRQTVQWAGDPRKPVTIDETGTARLHPRGSFALWEEEARGTAVPWTAGERDTALDLRRSLLDFLIERAAAIAELNATLLTANAQLEESAVELEIQAEELMAQREELVTQREEREHLLTSEKSARADAETANRAKADFLAVMSHELRTPLNAIGGYAELIKIGVRGPVTEGQLADLTRIEINQRYLLGLINSILNFTKLEAGSVQFDMKDVRLTQLLQGLDALIAPQMRDKSLSFSIGRCADDVIVRADEEKLRQILLNLLTNALKFTDAGGSVTIECGQRDGHVYIDVRDTGHGIAPDGLARIFEPFVQLNRHRTPSASQGVGLGLAISRELARGMQGDLTATSVVDQGSTFTLTLPKK